MPPLLRARDWKGSISAFQALGVDYSPGMSDLVVSLMNALTVVENAVERRISPPRK